MLPPSVIRTDASTCGLSLLHLGTACLWKLGAGCAAVHHLQVSRFTLQASASAQPSSALASIITHACSSYQSCSISDQFRRHHIMMSGIGDSIRVSCAACCADWHCIMKLLLSTHCCSGADEHVISIANAQQATIRLLDISCRCGDDTNVTASIHG